MSASFEHTDLTEPALPDKARRQDDAQATLRALISAHRRDHPPETTLILEGEPTTSIFLILSGWLLASKSLADGERQIIDVILPGDMIDPASADPGTSALEIETRTDVSLAAIPRHRWRQACDRHPELDDLEHRVVGRALSRMAERMMRLGKAPAETVITFTLCELCLRSTPHGPVEGAAFHIPMNQQLLGDLCGLSAVHVCRTLRRLQRNGVLSVTDHMNIVVHDVDAMARIADIDIEALRREIIGSD